MKPYFYIFLVLVLGTFIYGKANKDNKESYKTVIEKRAEREKTVKARIDKLNESLKWKKLKCGLWKANNGDIGFKIIRGSESGIFITDYITNLSRENSLKSVIDLKTFKYLGSSFYKDKNYIYTYYAMAGGGNFWIVKEADVKTFKVIGDCYAKDKNHIFGERAMEMKLIDYKTFRTKKGIGCFAKDKAGYYFWDSKLNLDKLDEYEKKAVDILKKIK